MYAFSPTPPMIENSRWRLRPLYPNEVAAFKATHDDETLRWNQMTFVQLDTVVERHLRGVVDPIVGPARRLVCLAIFDKLHGQIVGDVIALQFAGKNEIYIGYNVAAEKRGQGIAAQAAGLLIEHILRLQPDARILSRTLGDNRNSRRVMEKLGLRHEADEADGKVRYAKA